MKRLATVLGASCLILALSAYCLFATQIEYRSPRDLGRESSLVVRGRVATVRSFWNGTGTKVFTETIVSVDETYKGQRAASVSIRQLGGVVGHVRVNVDGAPVWKEGEEVLLFLEPFKGTSYQVAGFSQGKYTIERDPLTGEPFVRGLSLDGVELVGAPGEAPPVRETERITLESFIDRALRSE
jgi:hypothetical protein